MSENPEDRFYTINQVAEKLDVSRETVRREIHDGKLGHYRFRGQFRISPGDLADYLRRTHNATDQDSQEG